MHAKSQIDNALWAFFISKMLFLLHQRLKQVPIYLLSYGKCIGSPDSICFYIICTFLSKVREITFADSLCARFIICSLRDGTGIDNLSGLLLYNTKLIRKMLSKEKHLLIPTWQIAFSVQQYSYSAYRKLICDL